MRSHPFKPNKRTRQRLIQWVVALFVLLNLLTFISAYGLTHYHIPGTFSLGLPKPSNRKTPAALGLNYSTRRITIRDREWLETWTLPAPKATPQGTVLLFHGSGGSKGQQLLAPAQAFHHLGYRAILVDFRGFGGSSGRTNTLGMKEANDVATALTDAHHSGIQPPFILYGVSMGSAAILKAIADDAAQPDAIILELPFARILDAVRSRLQFAHIPTVPIAELLVFWGSVQHRINLFPHNPVTYAHAVTCPTLVLHGQLDRWTSEADIHQMFGNLSGTKQLAIFPNAGHNLLVTTDPPYWTQTVQQFLSQL